MIDVNVPLYSWSGQDVIDELKRIQEEGDNIDAKKATRLLADSELLSGLIDDVVAMSGDLGGIGDISMDSIFFAFKELKL
jgi:hypothetical protein